MENFGVNLNKVKQPKPDIPKGEKRDIQNPYVGIISDVNPTSTPLLDTLALKNKETPKIKYKPFQYKNSPANFNNIATGGIIACGIFAILSLLKRK